jgi:hypothetical protein
MKLLLVTQTENLIEELYKDGLIDIYSNYNMFENFSKRSEYIWQILLDFHSQDCCPIGPYRNVLMNKTSSRYLRVTTLNFY